MATTKPTPRSSQQEMGVSHHLNGQSSAGAKVRPEVVATNTIKLVEAPNPHLQADCIIRNSFTGEVIREATAEFWLEGQDAFGRPRHASNFKQVNEGVDESSEGDQIQEKPVALEFCYTGAVVSGVDNIPSDWPTDVKDSIADLAIYREDGDTTLSWTGLSGKPGKEVLKYLQGYKLGKLWAPYMGKKPEVSWKELDELFDDEKGILAIDANTRQHPARCHFASAEEALIKLSVGSYVELRWEEKMCAELCKGFFEAAFFVLGPNIVIACVRRKVRGIYIDENAVWDDRMNAILKFEVEDKNSWDPRSKYMKTVRATGKPVSNQTPIDCDLVVLLEKIPQEIYDVARAPGEKANFIDLSSIYIDVNDSLARSQVASLQMLFDREKEIFKKWWPLFLMEGLEAGSRINFLEEIVGWSSDDIEAATRNIIQRMSAAEKPPNQEQRDILMNARYSISNCKLIWGPPGTGKTTLIVMIVMLLLQAHGVAVLVVAGSNGSTGRLFGTLAKWLPKGQGSDECVPLRVHKVKAEYDYFMSILDPNTTIDRSTAYQKSAERVLSNPKPGPAGTFYANRQAVEKLRHMEDPQTGVAAAVLRAVQSNKLPAPELASNSSSEDQREAQLEEANNGLMTLQDWWTKLHQPSPPRLSVDDRYDISSAYRAIARYIIGTKRLIVSTVGNATSRILQNCIFRDTKHVVVIQDEAGLETDASLVNILAGLITEGRVDSEFGGINPIMTAMLVGDHKQGSPLVKSDIAQANEFGPQLAMSTFLRLALSGFPLENLREQHRMVEILSHLPSICNYDGKLRTSAAALSRRLAAAQRDFIISYFGVDLSKLTCPPNQDRAYFEDQYLRHILLDVRGGRTQVDPALRKSKFNVANVDVTLRLFESMVKSKFLPPREIRILTFYNAQRQRYIDALELLRRRLNYTEQDFDGIVVHTSDSFQGREATCIIMDLVVSKYYGEGTLGHAGDEKKTNVAYTRARDFLFVVGDSTILDSPLLEDRDEQMEFIFKSLSGLVARNATKVFRSSKGPESELAGYFEGLGIEENGAGGSRG